MGHHVRLQDVTVEFCPSGRDSGRSNKRSGKLFLIVFLKLNNHFNISEVLKFLQ